MKKLTIIILCITVIWSYYETATYGDGCLLCGKTMFCRDKKAKTLSSLELQKNASNIERLVADKNEISLSENDTETLNYLTSLRFLDLRGNKIQNLSSERLLDLSRLEELDLKDNQIEKVPENVLSKLPNLAVLRLNKNKISKIPENLLANNTKIKAFVASDNEIEDLPFELFRNYSLEVLVLASNNLKEINTNQIFKLENLTGLNIRNNPRMKTKIFDPKILYKHPKLQFLFTSGFADCCNVDRMKKKAKDEKKNFYCSYKSSDYFESCATRITSQSVEDTFIGQPEMFNFDKREWETVMTTNWTIDDANAVCRETGHEEALEHIPEDLIETIKMLNSSLFPNKGPARTLEKKCTDSDYSIWLCKGPNRPNYDGKKGGKEVGVRCRVPEEEIQKVCVPEDSDGTKYRCDGTKSLDEDKLRNLPWAEKEKAKKITRITVESHLIKWILGNSVSHLKVLEELYLYENDISWLGNGVFRIESLKLLNLQSNKLNILVTNDKRKEPGWFLGLENLTTLNIGSNGLKTFPSAAFKPLKNLHNLTIARNDFTELPDDFFEELTTVRRLYMSKMPGLLIFNWDKHMNYLKPNLLHIETSVFTDCCYVESYKPSVTCIAPANALANCERMIKFAELRYLMWFLVVLTIGGNMFALLMRLVKDDNNRVQNMLICSLSFSDMLMGVYLAGIINQDIATRGEYYKHDFEWRTGIMCKIFGVISVISSEVSVFTLVFIAYDRFLHIVHAMEFRKIGYRTAAFLLFFTWSFCSAIAIIPATINSYFYDDLRRQGFYGTNSICMPLQLPGEGTIAWEYCLAVFGALNFIGAVYLIVSYCQMFYSSYKSAKVSKNDARLGVHTTMAKRFAAVVFTDVCCWVPIAMLLLLSLVRAINDTGNVLYMWFSICVIPINSAINPILYTLSTPLFWAKVKETIKKMLFCITKGGIEGKPELIEKTSSEKKT